MFITSLLAPPHSVPELTPLSALSRVSALRVSQDRAFTHKHSTVVFTQEGELEIPNSFYVIGVCFRCLWPDQYLLLCLDDRE